MKFYLQIIDDLFLFVVLSFRLLYVESKVYRTEVIIAAYLLPELKTIHPKVGIIG